MEHVDKFKAAVAAVVAALTALWGWYGWLVVIWGICMLLDYATGTGAALKEGKWSSSVAREGIWHKVGSIAAALVACLLDAAIGQAAANLPGFPIDYSVFLGPLVVVWYILTECGSIVENAGALGAPIPQWLARRVAALREEVAPEGAERGEEQA